MASIHILRISLMFIHAILFLTGYVALEMFLIFRMRNTENPDELELRSVLKTTLGDATNNLFNKYYLISRRRFGTLVFGLSCLAGFGFTITLSMLAFAEDEKALDFVLTLWKIDVILCAFILFIVVPVGLCHKYIKFGSTLKLRQRLLRILAFVCAWICFGLLVGRTLLNEMFFQRNTNELTFILICTLYMCGFGLSFIAILVGFSGIYLPYILFIIHHDVSSVRQLEHRISDSYRAIRQIKSKLNDETLLSDEDDSCYEDDIPMAEFYRTSDYHDKLSLTSKSFDVLKPTNALDNGPNKQLNSNEPLYKQIYNSVTQLLRKTTEPRGNLTDINTNESLKNMLNDIRDELAYLKMIKEQKNSKTKLSGRILSFAKYLIAIACSLNCLNISRRVLLVLMDSTDRSTKQGNALALTRSYYTFMEDDVIATMLNNVLVGIELPTIFDFIISRANTIFLACVIVSNVGYFFDFGRLLLRTKYLQKKKLLTDNTIGLALSGFFILSFPSQFFLVIPFLPYRLKQPIFGLLFESDIYVWFGLRHRFDIYVFISIIVTVIGVTCLHYNKSVRKISDYVACNV